ncbi:glycosyltransferase family 2 protein [Paenibacillus sp. PsM32]|uniref:glycosyltransferase family 2 protein n=1 Tax=Paenibacillus sp. PsM32 TaxID=3030536 RepID=UPI00263A691F|nr:glycosyltransferase family 2 protein [Paenibacillus sp. PsM32]MDN4620705.1 glycosyltransferase family 2 protein [Paenibacillus sp. PsM32]
MSEQGLLQVLLSTYNGEKYISEQLNSILSQPYQPIQILIRDDGSSDNTLLIIKQYQQDHPGRIHLIQGKNIGVVPSFWTLMQHADLSADYFCFCDQDDVWMPHKAQRSVQLLSEMEKENNLILDSHANNKIRHNPFEKNIPAMVCTDTQLTDGDLNPTAIWPGMPHLKPSFYNALIQNIAVGATVTFNRATLQLLMKKNVNISDIQMHDWWAYLVVSCFGKFHFEHTPSIYYRQHGGNAVGGEWTILQKIKKKWNSFLKHKGNKNLLVQQAKEFKRLYSNDIVDPEMLVQLDLFIEPRKNIISRIGYLRKSKLYRQSLMEQLLFRFLILVGYI